MIFSGSVTERNFGIKAAIYGLLRLVSKTCSKTVKSVKYQVQKESAMIRGFCQLKELRLLTRHLC